jgi:hypothetical protein
MATVSQKISLTGIVPRGESSVWHSGDAAPDSATVGTDTTPVVTESYFSRIRVASNCTLTGVALLNGSAVAGNVTVYLFDFFGNLVAKSASTAQAGTAGYQQVPFAVAPRVTGPGQYYALVQFDSTSARFRSHVVGNFTAGKLTSTVYGTTPTFVSPNSFTASLGPICDTY